MSTKNDEVYIFYKIKLSVNKTFIKTCFQYFNSSILS